MKIHPLDMRQVWLLLIFVLSFPFIGAVTQAEAANPAVDEKKMYDALKEVRPEASEAEVEEVMGHTLLAQGNHWERASVHLKQAVQLNPKLFKAWYELALIYMGSPESNEYFKKSTEANPNFAPSFYWLAYNAVRDGHDKDAIIYFQKYLQVAKGTEEADRINTAKAVLAELRSGKPGDEVEKIRV